MTSRCPVHTGRRMPFDAQYYADPYPTYAELHAAGPVHRICTPDGAPAWLVTGYDEVRACLMDQRFARNRWYAGPDYLGDNVLPAPVRYGNVIMEDPPVHTRLRRMMNHWFLPNRIEAWRGRIEQVVDELLDDLERSGTGRADLMAALAVPLPVTIVGDLLGIPDEQRPNLRTWGDAVFGGTPDRAQDALVRLHGMVSDLVAARKADPKDDATSYWLTTSDGDGDGLDEHEVVGMAYFIILGGFDSTAGMIANSVLTLLRDPELMARLRTDPESIPHAMEELMRHAGSLQTAIRRFATEDVELAGEHIRAGDTVLLSLGAANRCPEKFREPAIIDFTRSKGDHVVFGKGPHICPGADLARIEISVALATLLRRFPRLALAVPPERIAWRSSHVVRAPVELPVTF